MGLFRSSKVDEREERLNDSIACYEKGNEVMYESAEKAAEYFRKGAEEFHDGQCQLALARMYFRGMIGAKINLGLAAYWLKKAAINGVTGYELNFTLGLIYLFGDEDVVINEEGALVCIENAAKFVPSCYTTIGDAYYQGTVSFGKKKTSCDKNYKKAIDWYIRAVENLPREKGPVAEIANIYFEGGYGIAKDFKKALFWSEEIWGEKDRSVECRRVIVKIYREGGYGVKKDVKKALFLCLNKALLTFDAGEIYQFHTYPPDYENSLKHYQEALQMDSRHKGAKLRLGYLYLKGLGVEKNYKLARSYLVDGYVPYYQGYFSHYGLGTTVDYELAYIHYSGYQIGNDFYGKAMNQIGLLYQNGSGRSQNYTEAMRYFTLSVEDKCHDAFNSLGDVYKYGYGVDIDYNEAFKWYSKAAEEPMDNDGQYNLAIMYSEGKGTEVNLKLALHWFEKAQHYGNEKTHPLFITQTRTIIELSEMVAKLETQVKSEAQAKLKAQAKLEAQAILLNNTSEQAPVKKTLPKFFHVENVCTVER